MAPHQEGLLFRIYIYIYIQIHIVLLFGSHTRQLISFFSFRFFSFFSLFPISLRPPFPCRWSAAYWKNTINTEYNINIISVSIHARVNESCQYWPQFIHKSDTISVDTDNRWKEINRVNVCVGVRSYFLARLKWLNNCI